MEFIVEVRVKTVATNSFNEKSDMVFIERLELQAEDKKDAYQKAKAHFKNEEVKSITVY